MVLPTKHSATTSPYVSAKVQEDIRNKMENVEISGDIPNSIAKGGATAGGGFIEWGREASERWNSNFEKGNPKDEWAQDMDNNAEGRARENQLNKQGLPEKEKEKRNNILSLSFDSMS